MLSRKKQFDAVVVGSGATGGWAAKVLCEAGLDVLMLEAGKAVDSPLPTNGEHMGSSGTVECIQKRCSAYNQNTRKYFVDDRENPYITPAGKKFSWIRSQAVGGRTLLWAGQSYRMSHLDFKAPLFDGYGEEWPIGYEEIAPYYAKAEKLLGISGTIENLAQLPDCVLSQTSRLDANSIYLRESFARHRQALIPARLSVHKPGGESASTCIHCGRTNRGCSSAMSSPTSTLADAQATGRLTLLSGAMARHLITNQEGKAVGVHVIDRETRKDFEVHGRLLFLCASALESTRILLNSTSRIHPNGFANTNGVLGHYLMDHLSGVSATAYFHDQSKQAQEEDTPVRLMYIPRSQNLGIGTASQFLRGYGYQVTLLHAENYAINAGPTCGPVDTGQKPMGAFLKDKMIVRLQAFGEMLPRFENYVEIDPQGKVDAWGVPVLNIVCQHGENEHAMIKHMVANTHELLQAAGATSVSFQKIPLEPGLCIHESGTCRMGLDPRTSVLNRYNQCHEASNVFVTDGSSFTSQGTQNPTLTMMALTIRACEYAVQQAKRSELN